MFTIKPASPEELQRRGLSVDRARTEDGQYKGDDPATPSVNEAYEAKPARKRRSKARKEG